MSLRSRRAVAPVSTSASTTIRPLDDVQTAREPQHRRHLRLAAAGLGDRQVGELVLDGGGHGHGLRSCHSVGPRATKRAWKAAASRSGSCWSGWSSPGQRRQHQLRAPMAAAAASSAGRSATPSVSASTTSSSQVRSVPCEHLEVALGGEAVGLPRLGRQVEDEHPPGAGAAAAAASRSGTSRCGSTLVNHEPGPSTTQSAARTAATRLRAGRRLRRQQRDAAHPAGRRSPPRPVRARRTTPAVDRSRPSASMSSGTTDIGSTRPCDAEQPGHPVEADDRSRRAAPTARRSAGCRRSARAALPHCGTGAAPPRSRCGPSRRRRRARPAPSAGRRAAARRARAAAGRSTRRRRRP